MTAKRLIFVALFCALIFGAAASAYTPANLGNISAYDNITVSYFNFATATAYLAAEWPTASALADDFAFYKYYIQPVNFTTGPMGIPYGLKNNAYNTVYNVPNDGTWNWVKLYLIVCAPGGGCAVTYNDAHTWFGSYNYTRAGSPPFPVCSFSATPASGEAPLSVVFTDTSTHTPTEWNWSITDNTTGLQALGSTAQSFVGILNGADRYYDVNLTAGNAWGNCTINSPKYLQTTNASALSVLLQVVDATNSHLISNAQVGIYNATANVWKNSTAASGSITYTGTGASGEYGLSVGQTVLLAASAEGYRSASLDAYDVGYYNLQITQDNEIVTIFMVPKTAAVKAGLSNLIVKVEKNNAEHADVLTGSLGIPYASVYVGEGANWSIKTTDTNGIAMFYNRTPVSTHVSVTEPWYYPQDQYVTLTAGKTHTVNFSMVMLGETPVTVTAVPTVPPGSGGGTGAVPASTPTLSDAQSQVAMVHTLYENGPLIVELCVFVTILGLLGVKLGGK